MSNITQISDFVRQERTNSLDGATKKISIAIPDKGQIQPDSHESKSPLPPDKVIEIPELERLTETINKAIDNGNQQLLFEVDKDTHSHIIKVVDKQTGEVIRQVPGEDLLSVRKALKEGMEKDQTPVGLLLDTKV